jgi:ABC-type branched-subunit amino acid transport system substrate-binding protein
LGSESSIPLPIFIGDRSAERNVDGNQAMKISAKPTFRTVVILAAILVVVIILGLFVSGVFSGSREPLYLAVVGPMTGPDKASGVDMVRSINLYLEQANRAGGVDGKPVRLLVFDDQSNPSLAGQKALEIAQQKKALVVIGHLFSSTSVKGGEVYRQYGIPAITGSATTENVTADNEWYFRTVFSNHSQASNLANYVRQVLKQGTVSIVYDQDDYGTSLADGFAAKFRELGGTVKYRWSFNSQTEDTTGALSGIEQELVRAKADDPGTIFIAAHGNESEKIVVAIRRNDLAYPIVGGDTMGDDSFAAQFNAYAEEKERPGYYTDGIYAASPIIFDVAGEKAQQLRSEYRARYGIDPGWTVTAFYDAALVAVQGMKQAGVHGDPARLSEERKTIRDQLASFNRIDGAIEGANGNLYFDGQRGLANSVCMGTFMHGQFISAMTQLEPVTDPRGVNDLQGEMQAGRILLVDGQYMYKTRVVYTGVAVNQVTNLDTKTSTFNMDFYLWFRYQGQFDDSDIDFENADKEITIGQPIDEVAAGDVMYRLYRVKADFRGNFLFRDYPFDQQELAVRFRHNSEARDRLVYVVDRAGMRHMSSPSLLQE